jgi:hypothetical protein
LSFDRSVRQRVTSQSRQTVDIPVADATPSDAGEEARIRHRLSAFVYELQEFLDAWPSKSPVAWRQTLRQCTDGKGIGIKIERLDELYELNADLLWAECLESFDLLFELVFGVFSLLLSTEHWALSFTSSFCSQNARAVARARC